MSTMSPTSPAAERAAGQAGQSLAERTVCLQFQTGMPGNRQQVDPELVEVDTDKKALHISKDLLNSPELVKVRRHDLETRRYLRLQSLPSPLRGGIYLVKVEAVEAIDAEIEKRRLERKPLVAEFVRTYPERKLEARETLGTLYREEDYPPQGALLAAFKWKTSYFTFNTPTSLRGISKGLFEREAKKARESWASLSEDIQGLLRAEMKGLVDGMVERLAPGEDNKPKVFRKGATNAISEFLDSFTNRYMGDDEDLAGLVAEAKKLLLVGGDKLATGEDLRKSEALRNSLGAGFAAMKTKLDGMVTERPRRSLTFANEEE